MVAVSTPYYSATLYAEFLKIFRDIRCFCNVSVLLCENNYGTIFSHSGFKSWLEACNLPFKQNI